MQPKRRLAPPTPDEGPIMMAVGATAAIALGAILATVRDQVGQTNAALALMVVVVGAAALGGRVAGAGTAVAAVLSFDFFHTRPYLSLTIDSRDDVETTVLLLVAALAVGTLATAGRIARHEAGGARSELARIHRVAEAASSGDEPGTVTAIAERELVELLGLAACHFETIERQQTGPLPQLGRSGAITSTTGLRRAPKPDGAALGFELPESGAEIPVLSRGRRIGRFVLTPTRGVGTSLEQRMVAVIIADQVAALWDRQPPVRK